MTRRADCGPVHLATAFDASYAPFGAALLASIVASREPASAVVVTVLHPANLDSGLRRLLAAAARGIDLR